MLIDGKEKWLEIFNDLKTKGNTCSPRGQKIIEIEDYQIQFNPFTEYLCSFKDRKLSLKYNFTEFLWYLSGNRDDERMEKIAPFWKTIKNQNSPYWNSNYGYYFYSEKQINYVINTLLQDKDSRQACIIINNKDVMMSDSKDKICTNALMFRIRDNKLNMSVQMRSNDVIRGLGIDAHMFSLLYQFVYLYLLETYKDLEVGIYTHNASSFHIYESDFVKMDLILENKKGSYIVHDIPEIKFITEIKFLSNLFCRNYNIEIPDEFEFTKFIKSKI